MTMQQGMPPVPPGGMRPTMNMPVTTTFTIEGYRIKTYLGVVRGIIVRAPTISPGILGGLKQIIGGRIGAFTEMCEQARQQAYDLIVDHAVALGANAIVGLRYDASEVHGGATEPLRRRESSRMSLREALQRRHMRAD